jgi:hypothetical protein
MHEEAFPDEYFNKDGQLHACMYGKRQVRSAVKIEKKMHGKMEGHGLKGIGSFFFLTNCNNVEFGSSHPVRAGVFLLKKI